MHSKENTLIIYFSATGNTYAVAKKIASETGDRMFDLGKAFKEGNFEIEVDQGEDFGIVWPVYRWSTPSIIDHFIRRMKLKVKDSMESFKPGYCYSVETYGYFPGNEATYLDIRE